MFARQPYFSRLTYPVLSHCNRISRKRVCVQAFPPRIASNWKTSTGNPKAAIIWPWKLSLFFENKRQMHTIIKDQNQIPATHSRTHSHYPEAIMWITPFITSEKQRAESKSRPLSLTHSLTQWHMRNNNSEKPLHVKHITHWLVLGKDKE